MFEQPFFPFADFVVIIRRRPQPGRRALKHFQLFHIRRDFRHELERARARADHIHAFAFQIHIVPPLRGMEGRALERSHTLDVGQLGLVELPHRADHGVGNKRLFLAGFILDLHMPLRRLFVEARLPHLCLEADVLAQVIFVRSALEIAQQHILRGVMIGPVVVRLEAERIHVVRIVHAAAGIGVLEPGAANFGILLDHIEGNACLLEADGGENAAHTRADHHHAQLAARRAQLFGIPMRMLHVLAGKAELFLHEGHIVFGNVGTGDEIHHPAHGGL